MCSVDPLDASPAAVEARPRRAAGYQVYECAGLVRTHPALHRVLQAARYCRGAGLHASRTPLAPFPLVVKELKIQGPRRSTRCAIFRARGRSARSRGDAPAPMVTDLAGLDGMPAAFEALRQRGGLARCWSICSADGRSRRGGSLLDKHEERDHVKDAMSTVPWSPPPVRCTGA